MTRIAQPSHDAPVAEWTVYADALQEANDPRGELIALNQAVAKGMSPADRDAHVANHRDALFGPAAEHFDAFRIDWTGCLADGVELRVKPGQDAGAMAKAYLASPLATGTRALRLVGVAYRKESVDLAPAVQAVIEHWPARCRSLALVDQRATETAMLASRDYDPRENMVSFGELGGLWKLPLESVRFDVADSHQLQLGEIDAPALQSFTLNCLRYGTSNDDAPLSETLGEARWPALRTLELRLPEEYFANVIDDEDAYITYYFDSDRFEDRRDEAEPGEIVDGTNWEQLAALFENLKTCPLERLALTSFESASSLLETLQAAGLPKTLVELDLSESGIDSPTWFLANKALFAGVKRLVLRDVTMPDDAAKSLASVGPEVVYSSGGGAKYRYVVGSE